jgi:hypothetical protein
MFHVFPKQRQILILNSALIIQKCVLVFGEGYVEKHFEVFHNFSPKLFTLMAVRDVNCTTTLISYYSFPLVERILHGEGLPKSDIFVKIFVTLL